jgi:GNAT superfamily N-acetyltransferase
MPVPLIRAAEPEDCDAIFALVRELAAYEYLAHAVESSPAALREALFGPAPKVFCELAVITGEVVGFSTWFYTYSTFKGRHGLWLEDIFVRPPFRGRGLGKALLLRLARRCQIENLGRFEWSVLDWNAPSIAFYRGLGAKLLADWRICRLDGAALEEAARMAANIYTE